MVIYNHIQNKIGRDSPKKQSLTTEIYLGIYQFFSLIVLNNPEIILKEDLE